MPAVRLQLNLDLGALRPEPRGEEGGGSGPSGLVPAPAARPPAKVPRAVASAPSDPSLRGAGPGPPRGKLALNASSPSPPPGPRGPRPAGKALRFPNPAKAREAGKLEPGPEGPSGGEPARTGDAEEPRGRPRLGRAPHDAPCERPPSASPGARPRTQRRQGGAAVRGVGATAELGRRVRASPARSGGLGDGGGLGRRKVRRFHHPGDVEGSTGEGSRSGSGRMTGVSVT